MSNYIAGREKFLLVPNDFDYPELPYPPEGCQWQWIKDSVRFFRDEWHDMSVYQPYVMAIRTKKIVLAYCFGSTPEECVYNASYAFEKERLYEQ